MVTAVVEFYYFFYFFFEFFLLTFYFSFIKLHCICRRQSLSPGIYIELICLFVFILLCSKKQMPMPGTFPNHIALSKEKETWRCLEGGDSLNECKWTAQN